MSRAERKAEAAKRRKEWIAKWLEEWLAWGKENKLDPLPTSWLQDRVIKDIKANPSMKSEYILAWNELKRDMEEVYEQDSHQQSDSQVDGIQQ